MNIFEITLDVDKHGNHESVNMRQGDLMGTTISATLRDHDVPMEGGDYDAFFCMTLPDRKTYYRTEAEYADGVVSVVVDEQYAAQVPGSTNNAYFELWDGEELKYTTDSFVVRIKASAMDGKPAESYDSRVEEIMSEMREVIDEETVNEAARQEAEAAREAAESIRATTFETNEAAREATFATNEAERESTAAANEQARADLFTANEDERAETFSENEDERSQTFETNESDRASTFASNEAERIATFSDNEDERSDTFSENEQSREDTFTDNEATRAATFLANESQRSSTFSANEARREATYSDIIQYPKAEVETTSTGQILHVTWKNEGGEYDTDLTINEATSIVVTGDTFSVPVDHDGVCTNGGVARFYFSGWVGSKRVPCSASLTSGPDSRFRVQFTNATSTAEGVVRVTYTAGTTYDDLVDVCTFTLSCNGKSYVHRISATAPKAGKNAGFGTVSASVTNAGDTPSVEVTTSGTDDAKNIDFAFSGIQGADGYSPSVSITDSDSSHTVTITDSTGDHSYTVPTYADEEQAREDAWDALESTVLSATENANSAAASARAASDGTITDAKLSDEGIKSRFYRTFDTEYTAEAEGTILTVDDAYAAPPVDVTVYGQSTQLTITGKNLFNSDNTPRGYYNNSGEFVASNGYVWWSVPVSEGDIIRYRNCQYCTMTHWLDGEYVNHSNQTAGADFTVPAGVDEIRGYSGTNTLGTAIVTKNNSDISYEPYTGGNPSPNPDYSQAIKSVDELTLPVAGKNMLDVLNDPENPDKNCVSSGGGSAAMLYDVTEDAYYTSTSRRTMTVPLPDGTYTVRILAKRRTDGASTSYTQWYGLASARGIFLGSSISSTEYSWYTDTITTTTVYGKRNVSLILYNNAYYKAIQIERGSTATAYEPYQGTSISIDLQSHELRSLPDGTKDELNLTYIGNGSTEGYGLYHAEQTQRVGVVDMGTLDWSVSASANGVYYAAIADVKVGVVRQTECMCSMYEHWRAETSANLPDGHICVQSGFARVLLKDTAHANMTKAEVTALVNGAEFVYPLAESATIDLGIVELPTLPSPATIWADGGSATPSLHMTYELPVETTSRGIVTDVMLEGTQMRSDVNHLLGQKLTKTLSGTLLTAEDAYAAPTVDATVYGASTQVTTTGKNLLPNVLPANTINATFGNTTLNSAANARVFAIPCEQNTNYVFSSNTNGTVANLGLSDKLPAVGDTIVKLKAMNYTQVFSFNSGEYTYILVNVTNVASFNAIPSKEGMIEVGSTATAYEPYTGGAASPRPDWAQPIESVDALTLHAGDGTIDATGWPVAIDLQGHELRSLPDGTKDEINLTYIGNGSTEGYGLYHAELTQMTHEVAFSDLSAKNWAKSGSATNGYYLGCANFEPPMKASVGNGVMSDAATAVSSASAWNTTMNAMFVGNSFNIQFDAELVGSTTSAFKSWLATSDSTLVYPLATPVTHDLGTVTLPANPAPDMTAWADGGSATPSLSLTYERDLGIVIANLEAAIADLATS